MNTNQASYIAARMSKAHREHVRRNTVTSVKPRHVKAAERVIRNWEKAVDQVAERRLAPIKKAVTEIEEKLPSCSYDEALALVKAFEAKKFA